jgi:CO/xanthine dehydrogenase Mo-binding subunit
MGNAVKMAAADVKKQIFDLGEGIFQTDRKNLVFTGGSVYDKTNPSGKMSLKAFIELTYSGGANIMGRGNYCHYWPGKVPEHVQLDTEPSLCWQYAAHAVKIGVDTQTGKVHVLEVLAAHDVGRAINPLTCEGQIDGGVVQALGGVLFEEMLFGGRGRMLNPSFSDYKIPVSVDMPRVYSVLIEEPHREGPYGAKGVGEITLVPVAPAVGNAIYNAVGVRVKDLPITKERLLEALRGGQGS